MNIQNQIKGRGGQAVFCFIGVVVINFSLNLYANETVSSGNRSSAIEGEGLPHCVNDPEVINKIQMQMKSNSKKPFKYDGYRKALASDSDLELTARLIYSETQAAKCPNLNSKVMPEIAAVIANRISIRKNDVKSVIFERDQFASSLNNYGDSNFREFLCPSDPKLWNEAVALATNPPSHFPKSTVHYYLYKHHVGWDKAPWTYPETAASANSGASDCVRAFENKSWK